MKSSSRLVLGIFVCVLAAVGAYFWATGLLDSVFAYRSPLRYDPPAPGQPLGSAITRRIVFVLIDGLREDTSLKPDVMPFLAEMRQQGAWAKMHSRAPSYSETSYTVLLTGAWPSISDGPAINLLYDDIPTFTQDDIFSGLQRINRKTAISGYYWFEKLVPQAAVSKSFYTPGEDRLADQEVVNGALPWLDDPTIQLVLIHLDQVDYAGHYEGGAADPRWDQAAARADELTRRIAAKLDLSKDTLFITSDHGHLNQGGHGGQDPIVLVEPFILAGAGVKPGHYPDVQMVDVAPTLAAMLGGNIPASSQGHVLMNLLTFNQEQAAAIQAALALQQDRLVQAYENATGKKVYVSNVEDIVQAHQLGLEQVYNGPILSVERIGRGLLSILFIGAIATYLFRKRSRTLVWMLATAVLYVLLFNLRYALIDGNTYSLSSVKGPTDIVIYSAVTSLAALIISGLIFWFSSRDSFQSPSHAAELGTGWTLVVLAVLSLPVFWHFMVNGVFVTNRLPEFYSTFVAFLSLIQILLVGLFGPVLAGFAALVAWVGRRK